VKVLQSLSKKMRFIADRFYQIIAQYLRQLVLYNYHPSRVFQWVHDCPDDPVTTYFPPTYSMTRKRLYDL
jgi:hypothetical protein